MRQGRYFGAVAGATLAFLAFLAVAAAAGWPGAPNPCIAEQECYCERFHPGPVRQPANTFSALAFVGVGLGLAWRARTRRAAAFAAAIAMVGPGTMALHASMTEWGGDLDTISMFFFISFAILQDAARLWPAADRRFSSLYAALNGPLAVAKVYERPVPSKVLFALLVAAFLALEGLVALKRPRERGGRWLGAAATSFFIAFAIWLCSRRPDGWLCVDPGSLLQGHAAWHLLTAISAGAVFLHLEPELNAGAA